MALQFSVAVRNARLDAIESTVGASAKLRLLSGSKPASCASAQTGDLLAEMSLPADYMSAASSGQKAKLGTWEDLTADLDGVIGHFRVVDNAGTTCHIQGTVTTVAVGTGDMLVDNTNVAAGQAITVDSFTLTDGNS
jgi:hypothetical protein